MGISDIALTASMRSNLISLKGASAKIARTQERLASGKKVNSALDSPTSYFASRANLDRANDLNAVLDNMSEAITRGDAAETGIEAVVTLMKSAHAVADAARSSNANGRDSLSNQYNHLLDQMDSLVGDSGCLGTNMLNNESLTVSLNDRDASLTVEGFSADTKSLGVHRVVCSAYDGSDEAAADRFTWQQDSGIARSQSEIANAVSKLRSEAEAMKSGMSIVTIRQEFTGHMINTLQAGTDDLTLADMNEEGANMLTLQTRQSLATSSLSMANQAAQSTLKLF